MEDLQRKGGIYLEKRRASESKSARMRKAAGRKKSGEERQKERIRLFQLGLWVALILTQMMVDRKSVV